jgi:thioredoxin 1
MALIVTQDNLQAEVMGAAKPVILDVYATWCGPCQQMAPVFQELENELGKSYIFAKLNVDEARDVAVQLNVSSVPTFIFLNKGAVLGQESGYMTKASFKEKIDQYFSKVQ